MGRSTEYCAFLSKICCSLSSYKKNIKQNRQLHILGFNARKIIPVVQDRFRILNPYTGKKT